MSHPTLKITGRRGALREFRIDAPRPILDELLAANVFGYSAWDRGDYIESSGSRSDIAHIEVLLGDLQAKQARHEARRVNTNAPRRVVVEADRYQPGDIINGNVVTGLGRAWFTGGDNSMYGIDPSVDYVQYAYFDGRK